MKKSAAGRFLGVGMVLGLLPLAVTGQGPFKIIIEDGKSTAIELPLPVDPLPRIAIGNVQGAAFNFGLVVEGKRICCGDGSIWIHARIDGREIFLGQPQGLPGLIFGPVVPKELPPAPGGKKRLGKFSTWKFQDLVFTQILEIVPSKPVVGTPGPGEKRKLDTCRIVYIVENKGKQTHKVELRQGMDILVGNNDGALFASPATHPGKILDGVDLKGKDLPEFLQVLERPDLNNPGFVATMTFKMAGRVDGPSRAVLTGLGNFNGWEVPAVPAGGDSACALYWPLRELAPGAKHEFAWAYGGGLANLQNDGRLSLALGGSFQPGKLFTITAYVDDPLPGQTLTLNLPSGMQFREGKETQPVPPASESIGSSLVLWKARVLRPGYFEINVLSSIGMTRSKKVSIVPMK